MKIRRLKPIKSTWKSRLQQLFPCILCQSSRSQYAGLCYDCWHQLPWALTEIKRHEMTVHIACRYEYPLDRMILQYKYHQQLIYLDLFTQALLQLKLPRVQAIVAMPISRERLADRGFNQSLLLAQALSKQLNLPLWQPIQRLNAKNQKGLSRLERLDGIEQQFVPLEHQQQPYHTVLIIDDVVTTGASLYALSQALYALGCKTIHYACLAGAYQS